jgi:hypothetical protein
MDLKKSRSLLVGLGAAVAAFGAAAMMSAATAPTARADDFTDIIAAVDGDFTDAQTAFSAAFTDFGSNMVPKGLAALYDGVDEDFWSAPTNLELGTVEALTGVPIDPSIGVSMPVPTDLSDAETIAQGDFTQGEAYFADAATALTSGDYATAVTDSSLGSLFAFDLPGQELLIGVVEALGL